MGDDTGVRDPRSGAKNARSATAPALAAPPTLGPVPLSPAQEQLWLHNQLATAEDPYSESVCIRRSGPLDVGALGRALTELVHRHEILRTVFPLVDGHPVQVVRPPGPVELPVTDLSTVPTEEREHRAALLAAADASGSYDYAAGPLLRPRLVRLGEDDHRLYLAMPQMVFDGPTVSRVLLPELVALYDSFRAGLPAPLPRPAAQYRQYAMRSQERLASTGADAMLDHWRDRLAGAPTVRLPLDRARPLQQSFRGGAVPLTLPVDVVDGLRSVGHESGVRLAETVAAAFAVLLQRYSGSTDVVFGTMADLRDEEQVDRLAGFCSTPVPLRADLSGDPPFPEFLARFSRALHADLAHALPFQRLVRGLRPDREPGMSPLYQAMVVLHPSADVPDPSWSVRQTDATVAQALGRAKLDLQVELEERSGGDLVGRLTYNADLFEAGTAERMAGHWLTLLGGIAKNPASRLSALPLLTDRERREFEAWNDTAADYPPLTLAALIGEQTKRTPQAVAVTWAGASLTYDELDRQANRVAHRLQSEGAGPGQLVAVCADRTPQTLVGLLGILKSGAAYLPLDPTYPADRLDHMLTDSGAPLVLGQPHLLSALPAHVARDVPLDPESLADQPDVEPPSTATPEDLAYVIYTSGSTGRPKGVAVTHRNVVNLLTSMAREPGLGPQDTLVAVTTFAFDMSVLDLWLPLVVGARIVLAPTEVAADGRRLRRLLDGGGITCMQGTPATWSMLVTAGWQGSPDLVALCGGEPLPQPLAAALLARCRTVWNVFGPTETTVWSTAERLQSAESISIGRPIANTRVHVVDEHRRLVPVGVPGELCIGGDGVTRGYLNRPELTADRFVPEVPCGQSSGTGALMYRTGDLARFRADGKLVHLGRLDRQLKLRGYRIEPGEIEAVLLRDPEVESVAVTAPTNDRGEQQLVAYVVTAPGSTVDGSALRERAGRVLPAHMLPAAFVFLDAMPRTANGKLNVAMLPEPDWSGGRSGTLRAPETPLEERVLGIWRNVLGLAVLGTEDSFFSVGGDSLLAVQLLAEIEQQTGVDLPLTALLGGGATVRGLAAAVQAATPVPRTRQLVASVNDDAVGDPLFLILPLQTNLLALRHLEGPLARRIVAIVPMSESENYADRSIGRIARRALETLREQQPHGPYLLGGYSLGGLIAFEIARLLQEAGERVEWLGLIDSTAPGAIRHQVSLRGRLTRHRGGLRELTRGGLRMLQRERARLQTGWRNVFDRRLPIDLLRRYEAPSLEVSACVFGTAAMTAENGESLGWSAFCRGHLTLVPVPGEHLELLKEPYVHDLARAIAANLPSLARLSD